MTKKEFDEKYVGNKLVVHCKTEELANEFLKLADGFGYKWCNGHCYVGENSYQSYGENTCYSIDSGEYARKAFWVEIGYDVVEFEGSKKLYKISNTGRFYTTYTDFFFNTGNRKFASDYDYNVSLAEGVVVEIVGCGQHTRFPKTEVQIVRVPTTGMIYLIAMDGLELVKPEPIYPKGVKSVVVDGNLTTVTLDDGRVGYTKCSGADKPDSVVGFSVAFAKAMTGMNAKELRECLPTVEKREILELYHTSNPKSNSGTIGTLTALQDCNGKSLYVGDMVKISCNGTSYGKSVVAHDGIDFVMGIHGICEAGGKIRCGWRIEYADSYKLLKDGSEAGNKEIKVRIKK